MTASRVNNQDRTNILCSVSRSEYRPTAVPTALPGESGDFLKPLLNLLNQYRPFSKEIAETEDHPLPLILPNDVSLIMLAQLVPELAPAISQYYSQRAFCLLEDSLEPIRVAIKSNVDHFGSVQDLFRYLFEDLRPELELAAQSEIEGEQAELGPNRRKLRGFEAIEANFRGKTSHKNDPEFYEELLGEFKALAS